MAAEEQAIEWDYRPPVRWSNRINLGVCMVYVACIGLANILSGAQQDPTMKYQTLMTPAEEAYSIWVYIVAFEMAFAILQISPDFRNSELADKVCPWWQATAFCQAISNLAFSQEYMFVSLLFLSVTIFTLVKLIHVVDRQDMIVGYAFWIFRAPFSLHLGWDLGWFCCNFNVVLDAWRMGPVGLLLFAYFTVFIVFGVGIFFSTKAARLDPLIEIGILWFFHHVALELQDPVLLLRSDRFNPHDWDKGPCNTLAAVLRVFVFILWWMAVSCIVRVFWKPWSYSWSSSR